MVSFPHCKINLGLNVIAKRSDGFHDIETCFYPIPWTDILEIIPAQGLRLTTTGLDIAGRPEDNLCWKAYELLRQDFDLPFVQLHLHKVLPTGAGLGGGSADAAFTLRTLSRQFDLQLSQDRLASYAAKLGSDCAFFVQDYPMAGTGRGEILNPVSLSLKGKFIVLIKPDVHVATAEAYSGVTPKKPGYSIREIVETKPIESWKEVLVNDFERTVFRKFPVIEGVKQALYKEGAVYASMSGSGSAVFGIFNQPVDLTSSFSGMTYWSGSL